MISKIEELIEKLAEQYPNSEHEMTVESFAYWLQKNAVPVVERQDGSVLMKIAADLANRKPLRQLYLVCERQGRINTDSLHEHLDKCGDLLAGIALDIRRAITTPPELAELQATIAQLTAERDIWCKGSEDNNVRANSFARENDRLRAEIERLKGGQVEAVAYVLHKNGEIDWDQEVVISNTGGDEQDERWEWRPVYASQPAPISVEVVELLRDCKQEFGGDNTTLIERIDACLDKVKELNQ